MAILNGSSEKQFWPVFIYSYIGEIFTLWFEVSSVHQMHSGAKLLQLIYLLFKIFYQLKILLKTSFKREPINFPQPSFFTTLFSV